MDKYVVSFVVIRGKFKSSLWLINICPVCPLITSTALYLTDIRSLNRQAQLSSPRALRPPSLGIHTPVHTASCTAPPTFASWPFPLTLPISAQSLSPRKPLGPWCPCHVLCICAQKACYPLHAMSHHVTPRHRVSLTPL